MDGFFPTVETRVFNLNSFKKMKIILFNKAVVSCFIDKINLILFN